jgi:hypothetical protein
MSLLPTGGFLPPGLEGMLGGPSWLPQGQRPNPFGMRPQMPQMGQPGQSGIRGLLQDPNFAFALLANSRGQSFGQALGNAGLQSGQMRQQRDDDALRQEYLKAQIASMSRGPVRKPIAVMGQDGKPIYVDEQDAIGQSPFSANNGVGAYQPGDYTPASWAKFMANGQKDPSVLERFVAPRQESTRPFQNVERLLPDGSTQRGTFDTRDGSYNWVGDVVAPGVKPRVDAQGRAEGEAAGGQSAKAPALKSFETATQNMRASIGKTNQGMIAGPLGTILDYGDKKLFESRKQQLSTELRTVFRIPGEGTLSDQEQQQYGFQLPDTSNPPEVNEQIMQDLEKRVADRTTTPITGGSAPGTKPKETAAERAKRLGL